MNAARIFYILHPDLIGTGFISSETHNFTRIELWIPMQIEGIVGYKEKQAATSN